MTPKAGHTFTAGPWNAVGMLVFSGVDRFYNHPVARVGAPLDKNDNRVEEAEANARLIAEAGTVLHETGLTPRQLAEQRGELLAALKDCAVQIAQTHNRNLTANEQAALDAARAAIAKATDGGA